MVFRQNTVSDKTWDKVKDADVKRTAENLGSKNEKSRQDNMQDNKKNPGRS